MNDDKLDNLVIATHNNGKMREFNWYFTGLPIKLYSATDFNLCEPDETGITFAENALLKAKLSAEKSPYPVLADDSGLCVTAINNEPGIYSARWGGENRDFSIAMQRVWDKLLAANTTDFSAYFICVLAVVLPDGTNHTFEGRINGTITWPPSGDTGFGYDPIFTPDGYNVTFAQMAHDTKQRISHRGVAIRQFKQHFCIG